MLAYRSLKMIRQDASNLLTGGLWRRRRWKVAPVQLTDGAGDPADVEQWLIGRRIGDWLLPTDGLGALPAGRPGFTKSGDERNVMYLTAVAGPLS